MLACAQLLRAFAQISGAILEGGCSNPLVDTLRPTQTLKSVTQSGCPMLPRSMDGQRPAWELLASQGSYSEEELRFWPDLKCERISGMDIVSCCRPRVGKANETV